MKKLFPIAAVLLVLLFASCEKENEGGNEDLLIGNWRALRAYSYEIKDGVKEEGEVVWDGTPENELIWTFRADGTYTWEDHSSLDSNRSGEWSVSGNNLVCSGFTVSELVIEKLTSTELVIFGRWMESGTEKRGQRYYLERI